VNPVERPTPDEGPDSPAQLAARELAEADHVREIEYQAVLRELAVKDLYVEATEAELARVASAEANARAELAQVRARVEELFGDLGRAEAAIVEANGRIEAITSTRSYRWSSATVSFLGRLAPPWRRARPGPAAS
jgi:chromosome segregation ATPase